MALVTGAAKRIGREIALELARRGWDVAVHYRHSEADARATVRDIEAMGRRAVALHCDFADADAVKRFVVPKHEVSHMIVGGGGAMNNAIMLGLRRALPDIKIFVSDRIGISYDAREPIAFAILGNETLCGTPANVPQATGAKERVLLGKITPV